MESPEHARNFVFRVAVNLGRSHLRRRLAAPFGLSGPEQATADTTGRTDEWLNIAGALAQLSSSQRAAVVLIDYADLDSTSAAAILGVSASTARSNLMRGRTALREALGMTEEADR
jgi:DNA-directed RNA polymerase specialized sigma24 family protein